MALRFDQGTGLSALIVSTKKGVRPTLAEWRKALWFDFGIKIDRVRLMRVTTPEGIVYTVECVDAARDVKAVRMFLKEGAAIDPQGTTLAALKEEALLSARVHIDL